LLREISRVRATLFVKIGFGAGEERRFVKMHFGRRMKMGVWEGWEERQFVKRDFRGAGNTIC
jgi:hypothetical protein